MRAFLISAILYVGESSGGWYGIQDLLPNLTQEMKSEQLVILETLRDHPRASNAVVVHRVQRSGSSWPPWAITARLRAILAVTSVPSWLHYVVNALPGDRLEPPMVANIVKNVPASAERRDWGHIARMWFVLCVHPLKQLVGTPEQPRPCEPLADHSQWILTPTRFRAFIEKLIAECTGRPTIKYDPVKQLREFVVSEIIADPSISVGTLHRKFNDAHNDLVTAASDIDNVVQRLHVLTSKPLWLHEALIKLPVGTDWRSPDVVEELSELCVNNRYFVVDLEYVLGLWDKYCLTPLREWTSKATSQEPPCDVVVGAGMVLSRKQTVALLTSEMIAH